MQEAQDRNAMATRRHLDEVQAGQLFEPTKTPAELQGAYITALTRQLIGYGLSDTQITNVLKGLCLYRDAVRLEMMEREVSFQPLVFGEALPMTEQEFITSIYGK